MSDNVDASVDLHLLVKELHEVTEWYTLGALLGLTENEIKEIEQNHHETARRRMAMLSKWVKKDKNPSWLKIITALEEISETSLANQLREKYTATHQPRLSAKPDEQVSEQPAVAKKVVMKMSREEVVVRELEETEEKYLRLIVETESAIESVDPSQVELKRFSRFYTSVRVTTVGELFNHLEQYCFLDYTLLQKIVSFFLNNRAQFIVNGLSTYIQDLEKFKSSTTMRNFLENIEKAQKPLTTTDGGIETCTVILQLVGGWLEKTMTDLDKLLKELFRDKISVLSHIQIVRGSLIVSYCAPQWEAESLISLVVQSSLPLHQVGVCDLTVAETVVFVDVQHEPFSFESSLFNAVATNNTNLLSILLDINTTPDVTVNGVPVLVAALIQGNIKAVYLLLQANANPDLDYVRNTPLIIAAQHKIYDAAELLLKANANPNLQDNDGATPLHYACRNGDADITNLLLKAGADSNLQDNDGRTPLHVSSYYGYSSIVDCLLEFNSNPDLQLSNGFTALFLACCKKHFDVVRLLLKANANPNLTTHDGITPLYMASVFGNSNIVSILLDANADLNHQSDKITTPLMCACLMLKPETVRLLLTRGADPNLQHSASTVTALMCACFSGCLESAELLLMSGADPCVVGAQGLTALIIAACAGHEDIVHLIQAVELSLSSTTLPVRTANEIATNVSNKAISFLNKAMEKMLVAKSKALISAHYKNIDKTLLPKQSRETQQTLL